MNRITHGKIDLEMTMQTLKRKGMEPVANLLQCLIDNKYHNMQHSVSVMYQEGKEYVVWREEKRVDERAAPVERMPEDARHVHDQYFGVRS